MAGNGHEFRQEKIFRFWKSHLRAYEASGLSLAEYCRHQGLYYHAFRYWRKKIQRSSAGSRIALVQIGQICSSGKQDPPVERRCPSDLRLWVDDRLRVEVGDGFCASTLSRLLRVLESL